MAPSSSVLKIGIIGAGYAGTAFAAACHRLSNIPLEIFLFEKTGNFGKGNAYRTPFPFHLLNVHAQDMSVFEDMPHHFVEWVQINLNSLLKVYGLGVQLDSKLALGKQFLPRLWYGNYLQEVLHTIQYDASKSVHLHLESQEVMDIIPKDKRLLLVLKNNNTLLVDKVILATGNHPPPAFPFPISSDVNCIANPWEYTELNQIEKKDPVLIVGTGLSMIDAILTLYYQQHQGKIFAVSRHGLLPLPHSDDPDFFSLQEKNLPVALNTLTHYLRMKIKSHMHIGGDWQSVMNDFRTYIPALWSEASLKDKKRFLRHLLPYWNIHRHRVHSKIALLLTSLMHKQQLTILSGRVISINNKKATIRLRHSDIKVQLDILWAVNCMGPALNIVSVNQLPIHTLLQKGIAVVDNLHLGLKCDAAGALKKVSGKSSSNVFTLGSLRKGLWWETTAVPEIRKQCFRLAKHITNLNQENK